MYKIFFKIFIRLILVCAIGLLCNLVYIKLFYAKDLIKHGDILNDLNNVIQETDIIYLAESSNLSYDNSDIDKRRLSEFVNDYFPSLKIGRINKGAIHAGNYLLLLENIPDTAKIKTVIVTMNLRSFGAGWINSKLETPLMKMDEFINPYFPRIINRFMISLTTFSNKTEEERLKLVKKQWKNDKLDIPNFKYNSVYEWDKDLFKSGILDSNGNRDDAKTNLTLQYVKNYAFRIDTLANPRIKDFDDITELCKLKGWNLIFNIVAENIEKAEQLCGLELGNLMRENRDLLVDRYTKKGAIVVDNMEAVSDDLFIDKDFPTEHYKQDGRKIVAKNVANRLKELYPDNYLKGFDTTSFSNDMEKEYEFWTNNSTVCNDRSFSGKKSSRVNSSNPYSVTFEKILDKNKERPTSIDVSCVFYSEDSTINSRLVIEVKKDTMFWNNVDMNDSYLKRGGWNEINYKIDISRYDLRDAIIKAYVWNKSEACVYVDDFNVVFGF